MNKNPIILIDDDKEDIEIYQLAFMELKIENEIIVFDDGYKFLDYINKTDKKSFFILCDINMSHINGIELKKKIYDDERLRLKSIPFLFFSTSRASRSIEEAYSLNAQGYFIKPSNLDEIKKMLHSVIEYWNYSQHPN